MSVGLGGRSSSPESCRETTQKRLEEVLDTRRLLTLYRVSKLVTASLDLEATLAAVIDAVHELTGAHQTALFIRTPQGDLQLHAGHGPIAALRGQMFPQDEGVIGRALRERQPILIRDMHASPDRARPDLDAELHVRAFLAAPLVWRDDVLGIVTTAHPQPDALSAADALLVGELAEQAAAAVVHARAYAQLESVQLQLVHNEKMTAVGQLVQGLAHEMNTPLNVLTSNMSVLGRYGATLGNVARAAAECATPDPTAPQPDGLDRLRAALDEGDLEYVLEDMPALVDDSAGAARRVADIVRSLGSFARHDRGSAAPLAIEESIEAALTLASNSLKHRAQVERQLAPTPRVVGHAPELIEVFLHLLINASQALEDRGGTVTVATTYAEPWVEVTIADTGRGIPASHLSRVFDPFFTTRPPGSGTGMGLAVCHGIVNGHGGDIRIESEVGRGTAVIVRLPAPASGVQRAA